MKQKKSICEQQHKKRNDNLSFWILVLFLHQCKFINPVQLFLATEQKLELLFHNYLSKNTDVQICLI